MKIFISWSGPLSHQFAIAIQNWLKCVLQAVSPFVSSEDIRKGARWFLSINQNLQDTNFGIVCLTKTNLHSDWILFESGALAKHLGESHLCTLLVNLTPADVSPPFAEFQHTVFTKDDVFKLVTTVNASLNEKGLSETQLRQIFEVWWPRLEEEGKKLIKEVPDTAGIPSPDRTQKEVLEEILQICRGISQDIAIEKSAKHGVFPFGSIISTKQGYDKLIQSLKISPPSVEKEIASEVFRTLVNLMKHNDEDKRQKNPPTSEWRPSETSCESKEDL